jgi:hypothetical protein
MEVPFSMLVGWKEVIILSRLGSTDSRKDSLPVQLWLTQDCHNYCLAGRVITTVWIYVGRAFL